MSYGKKGLASNGTPSWSVCFLTSMPSGLLEPISWRAKMWKNTTAIIKIGNKTTWNAKSLDKVIPETM